MVPEPRSGLARDAPQPGGGTSAIVTPRRYGLPLEGAEQVNDRLGPSTLRAVKFVRFTDPVTGCPGVRIYRQRLTDPVDGRRGDVVFILNGARVDASIDGERFRGTLLRADDTTTELEVLLGDARSPPEIATWKPPVAARMRSPRLEP